MLESIRRLSFAAVLPVAAAALAACGGWEGPSHWLDEPYEVGKAASLCRPGEAGPGDYPVERDFRADFAGWRGSVRARSATCVRHTDPLNLSKAAWVNCRITGPAVITHTPAIGGSEVFTTGPGVIELRANKRGLSCRPG